MKHRLLIAIDLPESSKKEISSLQSRLEKLQIPIILEKPEKFHITLTYLGRIEEAIHPEIFKVMTQVAVLYNPFILIPSFLDTMFKKHDDSFVYLGLSGETEVLKDLYKALARPLTNLSLPQSEKFYPYISIARFKKADPQFIKSAMDKVTDFDFSPLSELTVDGISLYESLISHKGNTLRRLGQFSLGYSANR